MPIPSILPPAPSLPLMHSFPRPPDCTSLFLAYPTLRPFPCIVCCHLIQMIMLLPLSPPSKVTLHPFSSPTTRPPLFLASTRCYRVCGRSGVPYSFGYGAAIGHGTLETGIANPARMKSMSKHCVTSIEVNSYASYLVTEDGQLFSCGEGPVRSCARSAACAIHLWARS